MPPVEVTVAQFGTGATVTVTLDSVTNVPTLMRITGDNARGISYSVLCSGNSHSGTLPAKAQAPVVIPLVAAADIDLASITVSQV